MRGSAFSLALAAWLVGTAAARPIDEALSQLRDCRVLVDDRASERERLDKACNAAVAAMRDFAAQEPRLLIAALQAWAVGLRLRAGEASTRALELLREADAIARERRVHPADPAPVAVRDSLALLLAQQIGRPDEALRISEANLAAVLAWPGADATMVARVLSNNATIRDSLGDMAGGRAALDLLGQRAALLPSDQQAQLLVNRSEFELRTGRPLAALDLADRAARILDSAPARTSQWQLRRALAERMRGNALRELGRSTEAEVAARRDRMAMGQLRIGGVDLQVALSNHGSALLELGRLDEAEAAFIEGRQANPHHPLRAVIDDHLAQLALRRGDCAAADRLLTEAEAALPRDAANDVRHRALVVRSRAAWHWRCGDAAAAERAYADAVAMLVAGIPAGVAASSVDAFAGQLRALGNVFEQYLIVLAARADNTRPDPERAGRIFEAAQLGRGGGAQIALARAARRAASSPEARAALDRADQLEEQLRGAREQMLGLSPPADAVDRLAALADELQQTRLALGATAPAALAFAAVRAVPLAEAQAALAPDEALLLLAVGSARGHVVLVTRNSLDVWAVRQTGAELSALVDRLLRGLELPRNLCPELAPFPTRTAHELYRDWIAPAHRELAARGIARVTVVPGGDFDRVPLDVLLTEAPDRVEVGTGRADRAWYAAAPWLARAWETTVAPGVAAAMLARQHALRPPPPGELFLVADPSFAGPTARPPTAPDCLGRAGSAAPMPPPRLAELAPLPGLRGLVSRLATSAAATAAVGPAADEALVWSRRDALAAARLVVFGTHGLAGPADMQGLDQPAIALAPGGAVDGLPWGIVIDGLLRADEIALMRLDAELVVVAACRSAAPDARTEETVLSGLARSFFVAGARRVLVSHWPALEGATTVLVPAVLEDGATSGFAAALRRSRLALLADERTAHPVHWAAFSLVGAP